MMVLLPQPVGPMMPRLSPRLREEVDAHRGIVPCSSAGQRMLRCLAVAEIDVLKANELVAGGVRASSGARTRWSGSISSTRAMRLADALALLTMMKMRLTPITPCSTMLKYVRNAGSRPA